MKTRIGLMMWVALALFVLSAILAGISTEASIALFFLFLAVMVFVFVRLIILWLE